MKRGFTLLEVLIAGGILFVVSTAVVGLSNSIVRGTSNTNDKTQVSLWAQSGLDLMNKVRDDNVANSSGDTPWLAQALSSNTTYGWYTFASTDCKTWKLNKFNSPLRLDISNTVNAATAEPMKSCNAGANLVAYRLICVESYAAVDQTKDGNFANCNSANVDGSRAVNDGDRSIVGAGCQTSTVAGQPNDTFCKLTKTSLNRDKKSSENQTFIPSGNAVKVRSVIIWQDQSGNKTFDLATVLANWKTIGNI